MDDAAQLDPVLLDLLVEWEERRAAGDPVTPEDLCRDHPERLEALRRRVDQFARLDPLLAFSGAEGGTPPAIPGFELLDEVGRGGMGVVYRAHDLVLDRTVAVKVPFGAAGTAAARSRFEREARALARLRHPNIVPVHTAGLAGDTPYLVMEYVPGGSLAERMGDVAGPPDRAAALVALVARSVEHAHAAGIVHRDLKPSNILLDATGRPLVSDFGVAALLAGESPAGPSGDTPDDRNPGRTRLTRTGAAAGTPAYASPESLAGTSARPSPAADIWSLGVILYECLTGRLPYPDSGAAGEALRRPPPGPRSVRPEVSRDLDAVVLRCLAVAPAGRYPTAAELATDLERLLGGRPVSARRQSRGASVWRRVRTNRTPVLAAAVIGAGVLIGVVLGPRSSGPPSPPPAHDPVAEQERVGEQLRAGGTYTFAGNEGHTGPFRPLVGGRGVPQLHPDGDRLLVTATGMELVELRPDVPCDRYEIEARVRVEQAAPVGMSQAGLYFCFRPAPADPVNGAWAAITFSFSEAGPGDRAGDVLGWLCEDRGAGSPKNVPIGIGPSYRPSRAAAAAGPWRQLRVRVGPEGVTALMRDEAGGWVASPTSPAAHCASNLASLAKYLAPWAAGLPGFHNRGGVGVYTHNCRAAFCQVTVRPLHAPAGP